MWLVSLNERSCNFSRVVFFVDFVCFLYEYWAGLFHVICVILLDSLNREKIVRYLWQKFFSGASFSLYVKLFSRVNKDCSIVNIFMIFILFFILFYFFIEGWISLISTCFSPWFRNVFFAWKNARFFVQILERRIWGKICLPWKGQRASIACQLFFFLWQLDPHWS